MTDTVWPARPAAGVEAFLTVTVRFDVPAVAGIVLSAAASVLIASEPTRPALETVMTLVRSVVVPPIPLMSSRMCPSPESASIFRGDRHRVGDILVARGVGVAVVDVTRSIIATGDRLAAARDEAGADTLGRARDAHSRERVGHHDRDRVARRRGHRSIRSGQVDRGRLGRLGRGNRQQHRERDRESGSDGKAVGSEPCYVCPCSSKRQLERARGCQCSYGFFMSRLVRAD